MDVFLIDHYDSFTHNVIDWLAGSDGVLAIHCVAWDDAPGLAKAANSHAPLVISPGPKSPNDVPPTMALLRQQLGLVPILGICLGHQMLAAMSGARIVRGQAPHHGTARRILVDAVKPGLLAGLAPSFAAGVYNSLVVEAISLPPIWTINARCDLGEVQAMSYSGGGAPAFGLQFHPESFLSQGADVIRANWIAAVQAWRSAQESASQQGMVQ
jgi:anthranilate synthase/aminodeoxychorismate synthase-like glutamine amidotransferase